jgi:type IV secretory pathway VirB2 component (pilin)
MQFSKIASFATLFLVGFVGLVLANPVARATSSSAAVDTILERLQTNIASPLASISTFPSSRPWDGRRC